jgi:hypothetical protein
MPFQLGTLDWGSWVYGLVAAFVGGGASGVVAGVVVSVKDPEHFAKDPNAFLSLVGWVFLCTGVLNFFAFLRNAPLPATKQVTTTTTTVTPSGPLTGQKVIRTEAETHVEPLEEKPH